MAAAGRERADEGGFAVEISPPAPAVAAMFKSLKMDLEDQGEPLEKFARQVVITIKRKIEQGQDPRGHQHRALSPRTKANRLSEGKPGHPALFKTGSLRDDINFQIFTVVAGNLGIGKSLMRAAGFNTSSGPNQKDVAVARIAPFEVGTPIEKRKKYAALQGFGKGTFVMTGKGRRTPLPSREYIGLSKAMVKRGEKTFKTFVARTIQLNRAKLLRRGVKGVPRTGRIQGLLRVGGFSIQRRA